MIKEAQQLHDRGCFRLLNVNEMNKDEKRKAQMMLTYLAEKNSGIVKARSVYDGRATRAWIAKEDTASPTVSLQSLFITWTIDAMEGRDVMVTDIPNAFIQADMPQDINGSDRTIKKITGCMVEVLVKINPDVYVQHVVYKKGQKVLYMEVLKAIYGILVAALLWYKKFRKDLESTGFVFNPYDPCVANKMVNGSQQTIRFHMDVVCSSHEDKKVNDEFLKS